MKFKFNLKLTIFLVSLFVSLLLLILGGANKFCLSFGLMALGGAMFAFLWYNMEKIQNALIETNEKINEFDEIEEVDTGEVSEVEIEERVYVEKALYSHQKFLNKKKRSLAIMFGMCGFALIVFGFFVLF
jgi:hypothetical protein